MSQPLFTVYAEADGFVTKAADIQHDSDEDDE